MWPYNIRFYWKCRAVWTFPWKLLDFLRTSNYARQQALKSGSSDLAFWKYGCELKLQQTLVKSLKICLKEIFCSKDVQSITLLLFVHGDSLTRMEKTHFTFYLKTFFLKNIVYIEFIFFYNTHVTIQ